MAAAVGLGTHVVDCLLALLVLVGPVPLCLYWLAVPSMTDGREGNATDPDGVAYHALALWTVWLALQIGSGLLLGLLGRFDLRAFVSLEAGLFLGGLVMWRRCWSALPNVLARLRPRRPQRTPVAVLHLILVTLVLASSWKLLVEPTYNFDSLAYHLPVMARWVATGGFEIFAGLGQVGLYPSHWELLGALLFLPFGEDLLVSWPNVLGWLHLGVAVMLLAGRFGAGRVPALAAAAIALTTPGVLRGLSAIQPDVAVAACFLSAIYFGMRWLDGSSRRDLLLFLLQVGMLCGLKLSGPLYVVYVVAGLLGWRWLTLRAARRTADSAAEQRPMPGWRWWLIVAPAVLWLALFWYGRNLAAFGNPFGTIAFGVAGWELFPGETSRSDLSRTTLAELFDPTRGDHWRILWQVTFQRLGIPFALLLAVGGTGLAWSGRRPAVPHPERLLLAALLVATAVTYWHTPYSGDNGEHGWQLTPWIAEGLRYGYPFLALLAVAGAVGLAALRIPAWVTVGLPLVTSIMGIIWQVIPGAWPLRGAVVAAFLASTFLLRPRLMRWGSGLVVFLVAMLVVMAVSFTARNDRAQTRRPLYGAIYSALQKHAQPDEIVGYVNVLRIYPAVGRAWNRVLEPALPGTADPVDWIGDLRERGITILLVGHAEPGAQHAASVGLVQEWVRRENGPFELLHDYQSQNRHVAVFRLH